MSALEDKMYRIIKQKGPLLPVTISKSTAKGTMLVSAVLTSMAKRGKVKRTEQNVGSSSLYYVNSRQEKKALERILGELEPSERQIYNFIKNEKVVKDKDLGVRKRTVLRKLKDFAKAFEYRDEKYWRYRSLSKNEAIQKIREEAEKAEERRAVKGEAKEERVQEPEEKTEKEAAETKTRQESKEQVEEKEEVEEEKPKEEEESQEESKEAKEEVAEEKEQAGEEQEEKGNKGGREDSKTSFEERVIQFLKEKGAEIVKKDVIRKKYEINLVVKVKSLFGHRNFFVKARSKKRINEKELGLAYLEGNENKMPTIFLTDGNLTNKAQEYANKELGSVFKIVKL